MSNPQRLFPSFFLLIWVFCLLSACDRPGRPVSIGRVLGDPVKYQDRTVAVHGTVTEAFSLLSVGYFKLRDDSGEIAVLPDGAAPLVGSTLTVHGRVRTIFTIGDQSMLVLEQWSKKKKTR